MPVTSDQVIDALRPVQDPELRRSIVDLDMVRAVDVRPDGVVDVLSDHLRDLCRKAIRSAAANSRKTVMARDFEAVLEGRTASE